MKLIDADALADNIAVLFERNQALIDEWLMYQVEDTIDDAPTIDAEPVRHGKWTRDYETAWGDSRFMCSVCHCKESVPTCNGEPSIWDYCPNCGAKMEEEEP